MEMIPDSQHRKDPRFPPQERVMGWIPSSHCGNNPSFPARDGSCPAPMGTIPVTHHGSDPRFLPQEGSQVLTMGKDPRFPSWKESQFPSTGTIPSCFHGNNPHSPAREGSRIPTWKPPLTIMPFPLPSLFPVPFPLSHFCIGKNPKLIARKLGAFPGILPGPAHPDGQDMAPSSREPPGFPRNRVRAGLVPDKTRFQAPRMSGSKGLGSRNKGNSVENSPGVNCSWGCSGSSLIPAAAAGSECPSARARPSAAGSRPAAGRTSGAAGKAGWR